MFPSSVSTNNQSLDSVLFSNLAYFVSFLKEHHPDFDDERLYRYARLVTSAVVAKIHTIDWTVELLKTDTLLAGMRINW